MQNPRGVLPRLVCVSAVIELSVVSTLAEVADSPLKKEILTEIRCKSRVNVGRANGSLKIAASERSRWEFADDLFESVDQWLCKQPVCFRHDLRQEVPRGERIDTSADLGAAHTVRSALLLKTVEEQGEVTRRIPRLVQ